MGCGLQCILDSGILLSCCCMCLLRGLSAFFCRFDVDVEASLFLFLVVLLRSGAQIKFRSVQFSTLCSFQISCPFNNCEILVIQIFPNCHHEIICCVFNIIHDDNFFDYSLESLLAKALPIWCCAVDNK